MILVTSSTKLFLSVSSRASGNGVFFYNALFSKMGIDAIYLSVATATVDNFRLSADFLRIEGAAVAAPFKREIIPLLDGLTEVARVTQSVNSVRRTNDGGLIGHNADEVGAREILAKAWMPTTSSPVVVIYGSGGVVPSLISAVRYVAPGACIAISARNQEAANLLANKWGTGCIPVSPVQGCDLFINATPISLQDSGDLVTVSQGARAVFDLVAMQGVYPFEKVVRERSQVFIRGFDFYRAQFLEQFAFFTGKDVSPDDFDEVARRRISSCGLG